MSLSILPPSTVSHDGNNNAETPYNVGFLFPKKEHLAVSVTSSAGVVTPLILNTDYTVTGEGSPNGGTVKTKVTWDSSYEVNITRAIPLEQPFTYAEGQRIPMKTLESSLDWIVMQVQGVWNRLGTYAAALATHASNTANPHAVTKAQVGLGNVNNTSDAEKPISAATATALASKPNLADNNTFTGACTFQDDTLFQSPAVFDGSAEFDNVATFNSDIISNGRILPEAGQVGRFIGLPGQEWNAGYFRYINVTNGGEGSVEADVIVGGALYGNGSGLTDLPLAAVTGLGTGVKTLLAGTSTGTGGPAGTASPTFTGVVTFPVGTVTNPSVHFGAGLGFWNAGGTNVALASSGGNQVSMGSNGYAAKSSAGYSVSSTTTSTGTADTWLTRNAAGIWQLGTTQTNALGGLLAATLGLSGNVALASGSTVTFSGRARLSAFGVSQVLLTTATGGAGVVLDIGTVDGILEVKDKVNTTASGGIKTGSLTLSGIANLNGAVNVTGQTELSATQAAATDASAMSRLLACKEDMLASGVTRPIYLGAGTFNTSGGGTAAVGDNGGISLNSGTTGSAWQRGVLTRNITGNPGLTGGGATANTPVAIASTAFCYMDAADTSEIRFVVGDAGSGAPPAMGANALTGAGFGFRIYWSVANSRREIELFAHNGTTYVHSNTTATYPFNCDNVAKMFTLMVTSDGAGTIKLFATSPAANVGGVRMSGTPLISMSGGPVSGLLGIYASFLTLTNTAGPATPAYLRQLNSTLQTGVIY
jgi:hypothetical protein